MIVETTKIAPGRWLSVRGTDNELGTATHCVLLHGCGRGVATFPRVGQVPSRIAPSVILPIISDTTQP